MQKRIVGSMPQKPLAPDLAWLDLETLAQVEITSEDPDYPIEHALRPEKTGGWRAAEAGQQTIRLIFRQPQTLRRIRLEFVETNLERRQEYVLRWSADEGQTFQDIVRQQWHFSPQGSTQETDEHAVALDQVTVLELSITPDISDGLAVASLAQLRIA